jgi:hypothetical protein
MLEYQFLELLDKLNEDARPQETLKGAPGLDIFVALGMGGSV